MPVMKEVLQALRIPIFECGAGRRTMSRNRRPCLHRGGVGLRYRHRRPRQPAAGGRPGHWSSFVITKSGQTTSTNYTPQLFQAEYGLRRRSSRSQGADGRPLIISPGRWCRAKSA